MKNIQRVRRILTLFVAVLLIFLCTHVHAAPPAGRVIRIGHMPGYGVITDPMAEVERGYAYEYFAEIAKYTGWTYEYVPCEWSEGMEMLKSGQLDFMGPLEKNEARTAQFLYPERAMGMEYGSLFIRADNTDYAFSDPKSFDGMRVGTEKNNFFNAELLEFCEKNEIQVELIYTELSRYSQGLKEDLFDAVLTGSMMALPDTVLAAKISVESYYYVTSLGNEAVRDALDDALAKIEMNDAYYSAKLYEKYYMRNPVNIPAFTAKERKYIAHHPTISVTCDPSWPPIAYFDPKTGKNGGISVGVLEELGKVCGITFQFVPAADYQACKQLLQDGAATLILPHTESAEALGVIYTDPYFQVSTTLVGDTEIDVSQPLRVGISNIQSQPAQDLMRKYPRFELVPYANTNVLLDAFRAGEVSHIFVNTYVYDDIVRGQDGAQYRALPTDITYPLRVGVSKHADPVLVSILNKSILRLSAGKVDSIVFSNTVNRAYQMPLSRVLRENILLIVAYLALFFMLLVIVIVVFNRRTKNQLKRIAYVDALTGLSTQAKFQLDAAQMLKNAPPAGFLLVSLDVDDFKYINDVFGYDMGNQILRCMAEHFLRFRLVYRLIGRTNADNFVFLVEATDREVAIARFSDILNISGRLHALLPSNYNFVVSAGLYVLDDPQETFTSCCDKANIARKFIKGRHASQLQEYTRDMDAQMQWKKEVTLSMEDALENGDFKVYLQPKYRFSDETLAGAEALVRWQHPEKGLLSPVGFIPHFERNGFITKLDFFMFRQVCILLRGWLDQGLETPTISVNLSRVHLTNPTLVSELLEITREYYLPLGLLQLELTENIVLDHPQALIETMQRMKSAGFEISVDDFGSGYSSLNLLTDLPVDVLKLDKGFLDRMSGTGNSRLIVEQVIEMAKKLHLSTVAEGVETLEQVELLRAMGCDLAQGYYYARPMPATEYGALLKPRGI